MSDNSDEELTVVKRNGRACLFESDDEDEKRHGDVEPELSKPSQSVVRLVDDSKENTKRIDFDLYDCEDSDDNVEEEAKQISIPDVFSDEKLDSLDETKESSSFKKVISDFNEELVDTNADEIKKSNKSEKTKKEQKHSKDALLEISSETHRMIREKRMRLPYHQPKQRTLTEFLARKKTTLPITINATVHQLHEACKHLKNLEKEVEIFYKHDKENPSRVTNEELQETDSTTSDVNNAKPCNSFEDNLGDNSCNLECSDANNSQVTSNANNPVTEKFDSDDKNENNSFIEVNEQQDNLDGNFNEKSGSDNSSGPRGNRFMLLEESLVIEREQTETVESIEMCNEKHSIKNEQTIENSKNYDVMDDISILELRERYQKLIGLNDSSSEATSTINQPKEDILEEFKVNESDDDTLYNDNDATENNISIMNEIMKDLEKTENKMNNTSQVTKIISKKYNFELPEIRLHQNDSMIDLDYEVSIKKPVGYVSLMEKFFKHTNVKPVSNKKTRQINVLSAEKNTNNEIVTINKETLILQDESDFISDSKFAIPGSKHSMLKKELQKQMIGQKEATWNEYQKRKQSFYDVPSDDDEEEEDDKCTENLGDDDKLNYKPAYLLNDIRDEDLEEDDVSLTDYEKSKNKFVDDEAEESDGDCNEADAIEDLEAEDAEYDADDDVEAESDSVHNSDEEDDDGDYVADVVDEEEDNVQKETVENDFKLPLTPNTTLLQDEKLQDTADANKSIKPPVFSIFQVKNSKKKSKENETNQVCEKLLERDTTGLELEYKVTGLEDIYSQSQSEFTESQLMGICSDSFPISDARKDSYSVISQQNDCTSSHLTSMEEKIENTETNGTSSLRHNSDLNSDESDTEELFRKKYSYRKIALSSDDENEVNIDKVQADNVYVDDDEGKESELNETEDDNQEDEPNNDGEHEEVFYDSEEEVVTNKAEQFFENEAELSESEWESEDENEKDLDEFEEEVGDKDEIDNDKLKEELGKIHMRQILDDDRQDIRLLQEMLLEDGELHSETKRHRKFQWKNILNGEDFVSGTFYDSDDDNRPDDDDDDEETELQWRRSRHERDMFFLQNDMKNVPIDHLEDENNSQLLQIGRSIFNSVNSEEASDKSSTNALAQISVALSPNIKQSLKPKCGSFLSRGEMILSRLALTLGEAKEHSTNGPKNSRNFVFASKSPTKDNSEDNCVESPKKISKRKVTTECTTSVKKVKLFSDGTNPGVNTSNVFNETFKSRSLLALLNDG